MQPLEAWDILRDCVSELDSLRQSVYPNAKGLSDDEITAGVIAFKALQKLEKEEGE